jgi:predicted deacylase
MSNKTKAFYLAENKIEAGSRLTLSLPVPGQSTYTPLSMPVHIVNGKKEGPVLFVSAAIHGDEINGIEIIRRLLKSPELDNIIGTLICIPIVNVYGFFNFTRYLPDRRDLNRSFPGAKHGSLAARVAHVFATEIVQKSTHGIDLHTGSNNRTNLPHVRANLDDEGCEELALGFGTPVILNANERDGSLRQYALEQNIPMLLYEAGEALRFDELSISIGLSGILNVMDKIGMIEVFKPNTPEIPSIEARKSSWVRAPLSGLLRKELELGARIKKGESFGKIADALGENEKDIISPVTGILLGQTNLPVVNEGDALFHIARFSNSESVEEAIETFHEAHIEGLESEDYPETS